MTSANFAHAQTDSNSSTVGYYMLRFPGKNGNKFYDRIIVSMEVILGRSSNKLTIDSSPAISVNINQKDSIFIDVSGEKTVSREHGRIFHYRDLTSNDGFWCLEVLGKRGCFVNQIFYKYKEIIRLPTTEVSRIKVCISMH